MVSTRRIAYEEILKIISLCEAVKTGGLSPFEVDIREKLKILRKYLPYWKTLEELINDAEAFNELVTVIKLQGDSLKKQASMLYMDSKLLEVKIKTLSKESFAKALLKSWKPIVALDQLTPQRIQEAVDYWNTLPPLRERMKREEVSLTPLKALTIEELYKLKVISQAEVKERIGKLLEELKEKADERGEVDYWSFIMGGTYEETVEKAYYVSFLISQGYVQLKYDPIEEKYTLNLESKKAGGDISIPIHLSYDEWLKVKKYE